MKGTASKAILAFLLGAASSSWVIVNLAAQGSSATFLISILAAAVFLLLPFFSLECAVVALTLCAGFLPGLPRLFGDSTPALFLASVCAMTGGSMARLFSRGESPALPASVWKWGGAFLFVAAVSAMTSALRGHTLFFLIRGGVEPHVVNSLGMTASDRALAAGTLFLSFAVLLPLVAVLVWHLENGARVSATHLAVLAALSASLGAAASTGFDIKPDAFWLKAERVAGLMTDPNALGISLGLLAPLVVAGLSRGKVLRVVSLVSLILLIFALEKSGSRSGFLVMLLAAGAVSLGVFRRGGAARRRLVLTVCVAGVVVLGAVLMTPSGNRSVAAGGLVSRLSAVVQSGSIQKLSNQRNLFWPAAFSMIEKEPLSGCGLGGFPFEFPVWFESRFGPATFTDNTTNGFLDIAAECGLPALLLALLATGPAILGALQTVLSKDTVLPEARAGAASVLGFTGVIFTGSHIRNLEVGVLAALATAVVLRSLKAGPAAEPQGARTFRLGVWVLILASPLASGLSLLQTRDIGRAFGTEAWMGLYPAEYATEGTRIRKWHWMGPAAFRRIRDGETFIRFQFQNARPDFSSLAAVLELDGHAFAAISLGPGETRQFRVGPIHRGARVMRIVFDSPFVPRDVYGGRDSRRLSAVFIPCLE